MMGATSRGKPGLKKYLLSSPRHVKEVFRKELDTKSTALSGRGDRMQDHDCLSVIVDIPLPSPEGIPPPLPELPEPQPSDVQEVLRVSDTAAARTSTEKPRYSGPHFQ